jgi:thiol-disulfide isomerase/thioredoxin
MTIGTRASVLCTVVCSVVALAGACKKDDARPAAAPPSQAGKPVQAAPVPPAPAPPPAAEAGTWYRATLTFDNVGDLPFFLHVPPVGENGRAYVINGTETAEFEAEWRDNEITITGPWSYTSVIEAELHAGTHALAGTWTRATPIWGQVVRRFTATPIDAPDPRMRFASAGDPGKPVDVGGTWHFAFASHKDGIGTFEQAADGVVRGYIKPGQLGDIRFLAGNIAGNKLSLSTFNGNSANLVFAELSPDGQTLSGMMSMQNVWNEKFTATRADDYHAVNQVRLKQGKRTVSLRGLAKYRGKPTIAIIFATWCSSCNDAYPFFKQLYAAYHAKGLEILGVAYDLSDDEKTNRAELERFRAKHAIAWELLEVPCTPETWAKAMPPELEGWDGLPITLMIQPDGTVQHVFGGWLGPATGAEGERLRAWFEEATRELVETRRGAARRR